MIEIEKSLILLCIRLVVTVIPLRGGRRTLRTYKMWLFMKIIDVRSDPE